jgi:hypothetical protein
MRSTGANRRRCPARARRLARTIRRDPLVLRDFRGTAAGGHRRSREADGICRARIQERRIPGRGPYSAGRSIFCLQTSCRIGRLDKQQFQHLIRDSKEARGLCVCSTEARRCQPEPWCWPQAWTGAGCRQRVKIACWGMASFMEPPVGKQSMWSAREYRPAIAGAPATVTAIPCARDIPEGAR